MRKYKIPPLSIFLLTLVCSLNKSILYSQTANNDSAEYTFLCDFGCARIPEFPGGEDSLKKYLYRNLSFPKTTDTTISGTVIVEFIIDTMGNVTNAHILKSLHPQFDSIALNVVKQMPQWKPAINYCGGNTKGKKDTVTLRQPIHFKRKKE
jgi:TonB family protein